MHTRMLDAHMPAQTWEHTFLKLSKEEVSFSDIFNTFQHLTCCNNIKSYIYRFKLSSLVFFFFFNFLSSLFFFFDFWPQKL